jgi:hypothetical protein
MDHQHRDTLGARDLDKQKVIRINAVKAAFDELGEALDDLKHQPDIDQRALALAKTNAQTAAMWAVRAIAQPAGF